MWKKIASIENNCMLLIKYPTMTQDFPILLPPTDSVVVELDGTDDENFDSSSKSRNCSTLKVSHVKFLCGSCDDTYNRDLPKRHYSGLVMLDITYILPYFQIT